MLYLPEMIIFGIVVVVSAILSVRNFRKMFAIIGHGAQPLDWKNACKNSLKGIWVFISQTTLFNRRPILSAVHAGIAWGFVLYMLVNVFDVAYGFHLHIDLIPYLTNFYRIFVDIFSVVVMLGVIWFLVRRFILRDEILEIRDNVKIHTNAKSGMRRDSLIVGFFILFHIGGRFVGESFHLAKVGTDKFQPFASFLSKMWGSCSAENLVISEHIAWWFALGLILAFIPYFPFSKHAHLFMGPLNTMTKPEKCSPATIETIDMEDESVEQWGVGRLNHLPQTQIFDAFACIACSRCAEVCPAYQTGKELSPSAMEINKRYYISEHFSDLADGKFPEEKLTDWMFSTDAMWACTTCSACIEACPVGNEPMVDILRIRQDAVLMDGAMPSEAAQALRGIENSGSPWSVPNDAREDWIGDLKVPKMREKSDVEYLYWVGCAGAIDDNAQKVSRAMIQILEKAGVSYAILGNEETCTGDSARRIGNEYLFQMMAMQNIETFEKYGVKKIITQCPHCFNTIQNEYPIFDGKYEVIHHTEFIAELIRNGKLTIENGEIEAITYHDSCYLGRHNGIYDAPRNVLKSLPGVGLREMPRTKDNGFCCGAGGGRMWMEESGEKINVNRAKEADNLGCDVVATACPFCFTMMDDGIKEVNENGAKTKDIAVIVAERME